MHTGLEQQPLLADRTTARGHPHTRAFLGSEHEMLIIERQEDLQLHDLELASLR